MTSDYARIEHAIHFLHDNVRRQPGMDELAAELGMSRHHFQRLFRRWAGVSPKRFLEYLSVEHAKRMLDGAHSVMDAAWRLGMSGPARLHDQFVAIEAVTPGEYKAGGQGVDIRYGVHDSPFGDVLVAQTARGICAMSFIDSGDPQANIAAVRDSWPRATLIADPSATADTAARLFDGSANGTRIPLLVKGTNFQVNVWRALLRIPCGQVTSYSALADSMERPRAARSVASAIAANPVAWLIPCHRVIRASGVVGEYHWGGQRKQLMLAWEAAQCGVTDVCE